MIQYTVAEQNEIEGVLALQAKYQIDSIKPEDKKDGFVTTPFTEKQLENLIKDESGLFVAKDELRVVAYVMAASWQYWAEWPMFQKMIEGLSQLAFMKQELSTKNSYQYGPVCIDKAYRGSGLLEELFDFSRKEMAQRFPIMITFINKNNPRSYDAHTRKLGMTLIHEFEFNSNTYFELAYDTSKNVKGSQ